jgi:hypothetical protein
MKSKVLCLSLLVCILLILVGCRASSSQVAGEFSTVRYYYDSVHDVGIWTVGEGSYGPSIAVLPGNQIKNKESVNK